MVDWICPVCGQAKLEALNRLDTEMEVRLLCYQKLC